MTTQLTFALRLPNILEILFKRYVCLIVELRSCFKILKILCGLTSLLLFQCIYTCVMVTVLLEYIISNQ